MKCELSAGMRFSLISRFFKKRLDEAGSRMGLTGVQLMVLGQLNRLEHSDLERICQKDLEKAAHLGHPTMTELIKKLEKKGFVECSVSSIDRRSKLICSTEKAHCLQGELERVDSEVFETMCRGLTEEQRLAVTAALDIMLKNAFDTMGKEVCESDD
ncbi:MAG: MarR family transcriptional regulator [Oscillospiraceae bacterium]|nr:MarR family transcriptional regulator [Oscillospiraceae bacterium]